MNPAHLHLLLNHLPVVGTVFGLLILLGGMGLKLPLARRTALWVFVLSAVLALPSFLSGEGAEDIAEQVAGVDSAFIERHEELASLYVWCIGGLGLLALVTLWADWRKKAGASYLYLVVLFVSLVAIGLSTRVSNSGGEIRHTEIRKTTALNQTDTPRNDVREDDDD